MGLGACGTIAGWGAAARLGLAGLALAFLAGCAATTPRGATFLGSVLGQPAPDLAPFGERVYTKEEIRQRLPAAHLGDEAYAEVNSAWPAGWYETFRHELFALGVMRLDERFDCNRFADAYTSLAQVAFYRASFSRSTRANALALGPVWYQRERGGAHAVVQALTERGLIYIDPQSGREVQLTASERRSAFLQTI